MLSEARARLANTQGKKAKRKARERQLEESRRLAVLQKRRELKNAGINTKVVSRKKGQMDYNADIPFEKPAAPGFYDTAEEETRNERQRELFDPRKQQLANKRKGDQDNDGERKRQKNEKGPAAASAAAAKAGQMQRIREAEQSSKRRALNLPAPQVSEGELEDIIKMGMAGEQANQAAGEEDGSRGLISNYGSIVGGTPIRTPRAPAQEDHIANEIRNIRALTETQSSLLGGENTPLHEGIGSTGFAGIAPRTQQIVTPNPMATPFRQGMNGAGVGATPMMTPRDNFAINKDDGSMQLVGATPRDIKLRDGFMRQQLRAKLSSLPKPKETEWELEELPSIPDESAGPTKAEVEDAAEVDRRRKAAEEAAAAAEFKRQSQAYQRGLPRPIFVDVALLLKTAEETQDPFQALIARETAMLIANDARKFPLPDTIVQGMAPKLEGIEDDLLTKARAQLVFETASAEDTGRWNSDFDAAWDASYQSSGLPGLEEYGDDDEDDRLDSEQPAAFENVQTSILAAADAGNKLEKKLALHLGGYQARAKTLREKISEAAEQLEQASSALNTFETLRIAEDAALPRRLDGLREEVTFITRREREAQDEWKSRKEELDGLRNGVNGWH